MERHAQFGAAQPQPTTLGTNNIRPNRIVASSLDAKERTPQVAAARILAPIGPSQFVFLQHWSVFQIASTQSLQASRTHSLLEDPPPSSLSTYWVPATFSSPPPVFSHYKVG